jgi:hypothetical protein
MTLESIFHALLPFTGYFNWSGPSLSDPNDGGLAMVSAALGRHDDADRFFAATLDLCNRAAAQAIAARTHCDWGRVMAGRGETAAAREHVELAVAAGERLGMTGPHGVVVRGRELLTSLEPN